MDLSEIKVDPRTGVPIDPEEILHKVSVGSKSGIPRKVIIGFLLLNLVFPVLSFVLGFLVFQNWVDGVFFALWGQIMGLLFIRVAIWVLSA